MLTCSSVEQGRVTKKEAASPVNLSNRGTHHRQTCRVPIHVTGRPAGRLFTSSADLPGGRTVSSADLPNRPAGHQSSRDLPAPVITPRQLPLPEWSREYSTPSHSSTSQVSFSFSFVPLSEHYTTPTTRRVNCELHCWTDFLQRDLRPVSSTSLLF